MRWVAVNPKGKDEICLLKRSLRQAYDCDFKTLYALEISSEVLSAWKYPLNSIALWVVTKWCHIEIYLFLNPGWSVDAISMPNYPFIGNTQMDMRDAIHMNQECPFEYF